MQKRIIDKRKKEKFILDDEYLNGQARLCGWQATIVYNSLCRHADKDQKCFPSITKLMEQHNVSRNTIIKGLKNLEKRNIIDIEKTRSDKGQWLNNIYILLDKSEWIYAQVLEEDVAIQVPVKDTVQVPLVTKPSPSRDKTKSLTGTLRKHIEGNTYKGCCHLEKGLNYWNEKSNIKMDRIKNTTINSIGLFKKARATTTHMEQAWKKVAPTEDDWKLALKNYAVEIANRDPSNDYANHRFSLYEFIKQKNGYIKFLNK